MNAQRADPANVLLDLIGGHRVTAAVYVAARLGIADILLEGPKSAAELARLTECHERSLLRLMRALVTLAICAETVDGRFSLTDEGKLLAANSERSLKAWTLFEGELLRVGWGQLLESVRTGKTADELAGLGQDRFEVLAKTKNANLVNEAMVSFSRSAIPTLLSAYDFSGISTLMDVGGGLGELMSALLRKYPAMSGIVFDLPHCAEGAGKNLAHAGVADRCKFVGGTFFEPVLPTGADAIVMKSVVHNWNDERCARILQNCRAVLQPGARLIVIDRVLPEKLEPTADNVSAVLSDLNMLRGPGGSERTESEFRKLLAKEAFRLRRVLPAGRYSVIEASAE